MFKDKKNYKYLKIVFFVLITRSISVSLAMEEEETPGSVELADRIFSVFPEEVSFHILSFVKEPDLLRMKLINKQTSEHLDRYFPEYVRMYLKINDQDNFPSLPVLLADSLKAVRKLGLIYVPRDSELNYFAPNHDLEQIYSFSQYRIRILLKERQKRENYLEACIKYLKLWKRFRQNAFLSTQSDENLFKIYKDHKKFQKSIIQSENASLILLQNFEVDTIETQLFLLAKVFFYGNKRSIAAQILISIFSKMNERANENIQYFALKHRLAIPGIEQSNFLRLRYFAHLSKSLENKISYKASLFLARVFSRFQDMSHKGFYASTSSGDVWVGGFEENYLFSYQRGKDFYVPSNMGGPSSEVVYIKNNLTLAPGITYTINTGILYIGGDVNLNPDSKLIINAPYIKVKGSIYPSQSIVTTSPHSIILTFCKDAFIGQSGAPTKNVSRGNIIPYDWYLAAVEKEHVNPYKCLFKICADESLSEEMVCTLAEKFISRGINLNTRHKNSGKNLLHIAAGFNKTYLLDFLINMGAWIDSCTWEGYTPLMMAASFGDNLPTVKFLINKGANLNIKTKPNFYSLTGGEETALHCAAQEGATENFKALIHYGADINSVTRSGLTAVELLKFAAGSDKMSNNDYMEVLKWLKERQTASNYIFLETELEDATLKFINNKLNSDKGHGDDLPILQKEYREISEWLDKMNLKKKDSLSTPPPSGDQVALTAEPQVIELTKNPLYYLIFNNNLNEIAFLISQNRLTTSQLTLGFKTAVIQCEDTKILSHFRDKLPKNEMIEIINQHIYRLLNISNGTATDKIKALIGFIEQLNNED